MVYGPGSGLVCDIADCEDAYESERTFVMPLLEHAQPKQVWMALHIPVKQVVTSKRGPKIDKGKDYVDGKIARSLDRSISCIDRPCAQGDSHTLKGVGFIRRGKKQVYEKRGNLRKERFEVWLQNCSMA